MNQSLCWFTSLEKGEDKKKHFLLINLSKFFLVLLQFAAKLPCNVSHWFKHVHILRQQNNHS